MPVADDHPVRLIRMSANLTQMDVAKAAGVSRATVQSIEEGRTNGVNHKVLGVLEIASGLTGEVIQDRIKAWQDITPDDFSIRARLVLGLPVHFVEQYESFAQWRRDISPNPTAFASLLKVPRSTVLKYEAGEVAMPKPLYAALQTRFHLSQEYVEALRKLDVKS